MVDRAHRLAALCAAVWLSQASAQVTPAEPFGGRPFRGDSLPAPPPMPAGGNGAMGGMVVQPGAAIVQPVPVPVPVPIPAPQMPTGGQGQGAPAPAMQQAPGMQAPATQAPAMQAPGATPAMQAPPASPRAMTAPTPAPSPLTPPFTSAAGAARSPAPSAAAPPPVRGLPPDAPKVVISGGVWSPDPRHRVLIVNGQPVREGQEAGEGLVLEEVGRDRAVLGFRGQRYGVVF